MTTPPCQLCGHPLHVWTQPALVAGRPTRDYAECVQRDCALYMVTTAVSSLPLGDEIVGEFVQKHEKRG